MFSLLRIVLIIQSLRKKLRQTADLRRPQEFPEEHVTHQMSTELLFAKEHLKDPPLVGLSTVLNAAAQDLQVHNLPVKENMTALF